MKPVVAIVGRPNVGKSTLFNRLIGSRTAIVDNEPGLTRDRIYGEVFWNGKNFSVIDTGGLSQSPLTEIEHGIYEQVLLAIQEADYVIFLVDGRAGILPEDYEIASLLRKKQKETLLVVNKIDDYTKQKKDLWEFYSLGLGEPQPVSAEHGQGTGDVLDLVVEKLPEIEIEEEDETLKIAIIGRPNVGKSSLVNAMLGEKRVLVTSTPGTTRDAVDSVFSWQGNQFTIIDTAGLRRKGKVERGVEKYSVLRSYQAVGRAHVAVVVLDGATGLTEQDKKVVSVALEQGKAIVLALNKWDLVKGDKDKIGREILEQMPFISYVPLVYTSAVEGTGLSSLLETVMVVEEEWKKRVKTGVLNEIIQDAIQIAPPPSKKGRAPKILFGTQVAVSPPTFVLFVNDPNLIHFSYLRYLENQFREAFGFAGSPIWIKLRKRGEDKK